MNMNNTKIIIFTKKDAYDKIANEKNINIFFSLI